MGLLVLLIVVVAIFVVRTDRFLRDGTEKIIYNSDVFKNGYMKVGEIDVNFLRSFPYPSVEINDIILIDSAAQEQGAASALVAKQIALKVSLIEMHKKVIDIKSVILDSASLVFYTDENLKYSPLSMFRFSNNPKRKVEKSNTSEYQIKAESAEILLKKIQFVYIDQIKKKDLQASADSIQLSLRLTEKDTTGRGYLNLDIKHLTFNTDKGGYLSNSHVEGPIEIIFRHGMLQILPTQIEINGDKYGAFANLSFDKRTPSLLHVEKDDIDVSKTRILLTRKIQEGIAPFDVDGLISAHADIEFYPGDKNPRADIHLLMPNNVLHVNDLVLTDGYLEARFVNRLNETYDRFYGEDKQNLTFYLDSLDAKYLGFEVKSKNGSINFGPAVGTNLDIAAEVGGNAKLISDLLENNEYLFQSGDFNADLKIKANADKLYTLIKGINGYINFNDLQILYAKENTIIPLKSIEFDKHAGIGKFKITAVTPKYNEQIDLEGYATNIDDIIAGLPHTSTESELAMRSKNLSWDGLLSLMGTVSSISDGQKGANGQTTSSTKSFVEQKQSIKSILSSLYDGFHPQIKVEFDNFGIAPELYITQFGTHLGFADRSSLLLDRTQFFIDDASVKSDIALNLSRPYQTNFGIDLHSKNLSPRNILEKLEILEFDEITTKNFFIPNELSFDLGITGDLDDAKGLEPNSLNGGMDFQAPGKYPFLGSVDFEADEAMQSSRRVKTKVALEGSPTHINPVFEQFGIRFEEGEYALKFEFDDQLGSLEDVIQKSELQFDVGKSLLTYLPTNAQFPIENFNINIEKDIGYFDLMLYSDSLNARLGFEGKVDYISEFIYRNTNQNHHTIVNGYSPRMSWSDLQFVIGSVQTPEDSTILAEVEFVHTARPPQSISEVIRNLDSTRQEQMTQIKQTKATIQNLFYSLNPSVAMTVDTFQYNSKLSFENLTSSISMSEDSVIDLIDTRFEYQDGSVAFNGSVDLKEEKTTPFSARFMTDELDVAELLESLNYLNNSSIENIDELSGVIDFDLTLNSIIDDSLAMIIQNETYAKLDFTLKDLGASGLNFMDSLVKNKNLRERFKNIYIDSISNTLIFENNRVLVPLMEIQSNAFQFFVEGTVDDSPNDNIWISIPLSNLKKHKTAKVPPQTGYALAGAKVFMEIINLPNNQTETKFHLSKRKFFDGPNGREEYRNYKRRLRKIRKDYGQQKSVENIALN